LYKEPGSGSNNILGRISNKENSTANLIINQPILKPQAVYVRVETFDISALGSGYTLSFSFDAADTPTPVSTATLPNLPASTSTFTATPTPSQTPTTGAPATDTPTLPPTHTPTSSLTPTPTHTPTLTHTPTHTHTPTNTSTPVATWQIVENFNNLSIGDINGKGGWNGTGGAEVASDPLNSGNRALSLVEAETRSYKALPENVNNLESATLFFKIQRSGKVDGYGGLSDVSAPSDWSDFETQTGVKSNFETNFAVNGVGSDGPMTGDLTFATATWYCVWVTVDNDQDKYSVYVQGGQYAAQTQLSANASNVFDFRNGTNNPLRTFYARSGEYFNQPIFFDDIYISQKANDLSLPTSDCDATNTSNWTQHESFETLNIGSINNQSDWSGTGNANVVLDPSNSQNKVASIQGLEANLSKQFDESIPSLGRGTIFYRIRRNGSVDGFAGGSDDGSPSEWGNFEAQFGIQENASNFVARDGSDGDLFIESTTAFAVNTWYCVWITIDNSSDTYSAYVQQNGGSQIQISGSGKSVFDFRNGTSNPIRTFFGRSDNEVSGTLYLDDIYISPNQIDTSMPISSCS
ncbi:MAG: hypothetical protein AAGD96_19175, partial [Chloroflexota bacterium]